MIDASQISSISDLRYKTDEVLRKAKHNPVYLFHHSTVQGVLLSLEKYKELQDMLEDYFLSLKAAEFEKEDKKKVKWVSQEEVKNLVFKND